jgi:adenylate cyclase
MFRKALTHDPGFYTAGSDLYLAYSRLGEKAAADEQLKVNLLIYPRYLSQHPDDARGHMFYAIDLVLSGEKEEGKVEAAKALELNPNDPLMLYNAACFYAQMDEKKLALESFRNAIIAGYENFEWAKRDSDLDSLRNEPAYLELMKGK